MDREGQTTHFGYRDVPLGDKQALVERRVPQRGVALRPDERPDVRRAAPAVEGRHGHGAQSAARRRAVRAARRRRRHRRHFASASREVGGSGTRATVCDINADMLEVGRGRAVKRGLDDARRLRRGQCRGAGRSPTAASTPIPSPSASATCRASTWRCARRIACSGRARVSSASNSPPSTCPGSTGIYDLYSFNVIPALGRAVDRRRRVLPLSGGIDPQVSAPRGLRRDDRRGGLCPRLLPAAMSGGIVALHSGWRL